MCADDTLTTTRPALAVDGLGPFPGAMSQEERGPAAPVAEPAADDDAEAPPRVVRNRRHRFPARDRVVKVRCDDREHAVLAAAADRAGLTVAGCPSRLVRAFVPDGRRAGCAAWSSSARLTPGGCCTLLTSSLA